MSARRKLLVIGLDGYESSVGERLMREGALPALAALSRRSASVHLDHGAAKRTGLAWEHFSTGLAPTAANRWSAVEFDRTTYGCVQTGTALVPFPEALGVETVVFDPPYFDLDRAAGVRGLVSWGAHDPGTAQRARPSRLLDEVRSRFGDYPATPWIYGFTWPSVTRTKAMGEGLAEAARVRARIARWLFTERMPDWDLGMVVVSELHSASEALWHGVDPDHPLHTRPSAPFARAGLEAVYRAVDGLVATLVESCPDAAVLVFSMHGMGPNESDVASMALLPELLFRRQFGQPLLNAGTACTAELSEDDDWSACLRRLLPPGAASRSAPAGGGGPALRRRIPEPVKRLIRRALGRPSQQASSLDWMPAHWYSRYWRDMDAFALPSFYDGQIRINLEGREAAGRVAPTRYRQLCTQIEDELRATLDPQTGKSAVREIVRNERTSPDRFGPTDADMIVVWEGCATGFQHPRYGSIGPFPFRRPGGHTGDHGVALFAGPGVKPGLYGIRSAFDIVPTIAEYLTGTVDSKFSGRSFLPMIR